MHDSEAAWVPAIHAATKRADHLILAHIPAGFRRTGSGNGTVREGGEERREERGRERKRGEEEGKRGKKGGREGKKEGKEGGKKGRRKGRRKGKLARLLLCCEQPHCVHL